MANQNIKTYKRSSEKPLVITEDHKKAIRAEEITSTIIKFTVVAVVLLSLLFGMLAIMKVEIKDEQIEKMIPIEHARHLNISSYDLISAWSAKSTFSYADRGIHAGFQYPNTLDYLIDHLPALNYAMVTYKDMAGAQIYAAVQPGQDKLLNTGYMTMLSLEIISLVWIVALAVIFALTFVKKMMPSQTIINASLIIHLIIQAIMWIVTLVFSSNSTKQFIFNVGVGMWLNLLVAVIAVSFVIANMIYKAKVKMYEKAM